MEQTPRTIDEKQCLFRNADTLKQGIVFLDQIWNRPVVNRPVEETQKSVILRDLLENHICTLDRLMEQLWGSREDGGPLSAKEVVRTVICRLRPELKPGWAIIGTRQEYRLLHVVQRDWLSVNNREKAEAR